MQLTMISESVQTNGYVVSTTATTTTSPRRPLPPVPPPKDVLVAARQIPPHVAKQLPGYKLQVYHLDGSGNGGNSCSVGTAVSPVSPVGGDPNVSGLPLISPSEPSLSTFKPLKQEPEDVSVKQGQSLSLQQHSDMKEVVAKTNQKHKDNTKGASLPGKRLPKSASAGAADSTDRQTEINGLTMTDEHKQVGGKVDIELSSKPPADERQQKDRDVGKRDELRREKADAAAGLLLLSSSPNRPCQVQQQPSKAKKVSSLSSPPSSATPVAPPSEERSVTKEPHAENGAKHRVSNSCPGSTGARVEAATSSSCSSSDRAEMSSAGDGSEGGNEDSSAVSPVRVSALRPAADDHPQVLLESTAHIVFKQAEKQRQKRPPQEGTTKPSDAESISGESLARSLSSPSDIGEAILAKQAFQSGEKEAEGEKGPDGEEIVESILPSVVTSSDASVDKAPSVTPAADNPPSIASSSSGSYSVTTESSRQKEKVEETETAKNEAPKESSETQSKRRQELTLDLPSSSSCPKQQEVKKVDDPCSWQRVKTSDDSSPSDWQRVMPTSASGDVRKKRKVFEEQIKAQQQQNSTSPEGFKGRFNGKSR